jgi:hypothetical protein
VQEIAEGKNTGHPSPEKKQLAHRSTFAKSLCHGVYFPASIAQVMVSDAQVRRFQHSVAGKKHLVGCIPKVCLLGTSRQILSATDKDQYEQKMKYSATSHEPNRGLERQASQIA